MADPPVGPQAAHLRRDGAHQLVGVKAALHQHLALGSVNQLDAPGGRGLAVRGVDDLQACDVETVLARGIPDLRFGADQHGTDDAGFRTIQRAAQRRFIAGMHNDGRYRRHRFGGRDQTIILAVRSGLA
jgi:hypothetical protein